MSPAVKHIHDRQSSDLRASCTRNLEVDFFDHDEIDAILREIDSFDQPVRQKVQALLFALSSASSSLVPQTLSHIRNASSFLGADDLDRWASAAFDLLDSLG